MGTLILDEIFCRTCAELVRNGGLADSILCDKCHKTSKELQRLSGGIIEDSAYLNDMFYGGKSMEASLKLFHRLGIKNPTSEQLLTLNTEINRIELESSLQALRQERSRCYEYTLHCRNEWMRMKDQLPQDIVVAAETIMEGIQKGSRVQS